jgi:hypothetical protein
MNIFQVGWRRLVSAFREKPPRASRRGARPGILELLRLEERNVCSIGPTLDPFLFTPVDPAAPLALHFHPRLAIFLNGHRQTVPEGIGLGPLGDLPLHTHDSSGTIHVESPVVRPFFLGEFFAVWGVPFDGQQVLGFHADATHRVTMTVDGKPNNDFGFLPLWDGERIVIRFDKIHGHHEVPQTGPGPQGPPAPPLSGG